MPHLDFQLRFTTPAFLGAAPRGARNVTFMRRDRAASQLTEVTEPVPYYPVDPGGIRVPSLRGALEFWYRSLWGAAPAPEVFARQEAVFGSVRVGQGVRLRPLALPALSSGELRFEAETSRQMAVYLGYGPLQLLRVRDPRRRDATKSIASSHNSFQCRDAILVGGTMPAFAFRAEGTEWQLGELRRALRLLHLFGGLGARSRRGWGSVEVAADFMAPAETASSAQERLRAGLAGVWDPPGRVWDPPGPALPTAVSRLPPFSAFSGHTRLYTSAPQPGTYESVLRTFYEHFKRVRSWPDKTPTAVADHDLELHDAQSPAALSGVPSRLAFGMPYQPSSRRGWKIEYLGRKPHSGGDEVTRRSSPLLLKVVRLGPDLHAGVALLLAAHFFGDPGLKVGAKGKPNTLPFPGYAAIAEFFTASDWSAVTVP